MPCITRYETVEVDVDLDEFEDGDILDAARRLGMRDEWQEIYEAFHSGDEAKALQIAREACQEYTGRIL